MSAVSQGAGPSAAASALAMASLALGGPTMGAQFSDGFATPLTASIEVPAAPSFPTIFPR